MQYLSSGTTPHCPRTTPGGARLLLPTLPQPRFPALYLGGVLVILESLNDAGASVEVHTVIANQVQPYSILVDRVARSNGRVYIIMVW